ncbi:hypothetical protein CEP53_008090 [Fusarium sp. AF-6]|nr:hypothetical protein CEP53_008090 [Fusarium sp. AF-6]
MLRSDQKFDDKNSANATNIENASLEQGTGFEASRQTSTLAEILKNRRIALWCLLLYLLPINYGYEMTMVGKLYTAPAFQRQFGQEYEGVWTIKTSDQQLLNSANTIGVFVSACLNGFISDYLGRNGVDAAASLEAIKRAVEMEKAASQTQKESSWRDCFKGPNLRRTIIVIMVFCGQQWVGVTFIAGYLPYYLSLAGVKNALGVAQGAFAIQLFGNVCSWPLVDRVGRRPLMVSGCFAIVVGLVIIGCINIKRSDASLKATVALMTMWGFIYQATLGAITYSVGGETPSPRLRQKTLSIAIAISTGFTGLWMQVTPFLVNPDKANLGGKICFVFLGPSMIYCTYLFFCLPEMKGRSVEKLEEMFQERIPSREFRKYH